MSIDAGGSGDSGCGGVCRWGFALGEAFSFLKSGECSNMKPLLARIAFCLLAYGKDDSQPICYVKGIVSLVLLRLIFSWFL